MALSPTGERGCGALSQNVVPACLRVGNEEPKRRILTFKDQEQLSLTDVLYYFFLMNIRGNGYSNKSAR